LQRLMDFNLFLLCHSHPKLGLHLYTRSLSSQTSHKHTLKYTHLNVTHTPIHIVIPDYSILNYSISRAFFSITRVTRGTRIQFIWRFWYLHVITDNVISWIILLLLASPTHLIKFNLNSVFNVIKTVYYNHL
jgi:hypothetical protein